MAASTTPSCKGKAIGRPPENQPLASGYAGKPLDGSQYIDVIEEQEYADRRPSADEQKPRFSYMNQS